MTATWHALLNRQMAAYACKCSVDESSSVRLVLLLLDRWRPVLGAMVQRVKLLQRLRVWRAMRRRLMLLPPCRTDGCLAYILIVA